ncbi:cytochrome c [Hyalangium rubrum]|uniref:Cytochrome c n=1 Tax=Hyalangium rubrum TaxID=3103134 RepID=A0ABU5GZE1_9BACT|nr:cytochrome c [Hyalangium sp. s54d21]MDY7226252.1 cytochrome c [Hyalangium sp. s54d21]
MKLSVFRRTLVVVGFLCAGFLLHASAAEPKKKVSEAKASPGLPAPDYLPESARGLLRKKMERHGQDARDLMFGVALLQYDVARATALRISAEPRLVRPIAGGEDDLNALLPERFFVLQDEARTRAQAVAAAAEKKDDKALAESYGRLMETCVACHAAYLKRQ